VNSNHHPDVDVRYAGVTVRLRMTPDIGGLSERDVELARPSIWLQPLDAARPQRNRIHNDVWVPHDRAEARVAAAIAAGGHLVRDRAPTWWTLADAEGNGVDVATWMGRD
jgi:hypothetical protein